MQWEGAWLMISEQGPAQHPHADDAPTEIIQAIGAESWSAEYDLPPRPSRPGQPSRKPKVSMPARRRERRQLKMSAALAAVILVVLGVASYKVASGVGGKPHVAAAASAHTSAASQPSTASVPASPSISPAPSPTTASPSPSPSASSVAAVAQALKPAGVTAVGPGGATGDDGGSAGSAIDGSMSTSWNTDWYDTAEFGGLQTGTGLLIDMGHTVTITSVQVTLGPEAGNDLQVRVGNSSAVSSLATVATEAGSGGTVQLKLASPAKARYVLIWLTKLAPDGAGTYQAKVYNVSVTGQP